MRLGSVAALLAVRASHAWVTTSQARYGATVEDISLGTYDDSEVGADHQIGWLWSSPASSRNPRGLGQSITWAWDPLLCEKLLSTFKEEFFNIRIIGCAVCSAAASTPSAPHACLCAT